MKKCDTKYSNFITCCLQRFHLVIYNFANYSVWSDTMYVKYIWVAFERVSAFFNSESPELWISSKVDHNHFSNIFSFKLVEKNGKNNFLNIFYNNFDRMTFNDIYAFFPTDFIINFNLKFRFLLWWLFKLISWKQGTQ